MTVSDDEQLHQIGTVAERVGLSLRTIRHYEEVGLVPPSGRSAGGFRLYTEADIARLEQVKVMKPLGFSLEETTELLELRTAVAADKGTAGQLARLDEFIERADQQCNKLVRQLDQARSFTAALHGDAERAGTRN